MFIGIQLKTLAVGSQPIAVHDSTAYDLQVGTYIAIKNVALFQPAKNVCSGLNRASGINSGSLTGTGVCRIGGRDVLSVRMTYNARHLDLQHLVNDDLWSEIICRLGLKRSPGGLYINE